MSYQNENNTIFFQKFKRQVNENIHFLIKVIYNILWIIKKNIQIWNYSFSFKQTFSNFIFSVATLFDKDDPGPSLYHASSTTDVWGDLLAFNYVPLNFCNHHYIILLSDKGFM